APGPSSWADGANGVRSGPVGIRASAGRDELRVASRRARRRWPAEAQRRARRPDPAGPWYTIDMTRRRRSTPAPDGGWSVRDLPRLRELVVLRERIDDPEGYPFSVPALRSLDRLTFDRRITFLVGENGSGKSTLLEAIALAAGFGAEGGSRNFTASTSPSTGAVAPLARALRLSWSKKLTAGFFLRAESLFNVATRVDELEAEKPGLYDSYGGKSLHTQSHGESFLALVQHRFGPGGLYLVDEPEAALSPQRQLTVLVHLHDLMTSDPDTQVIVATHSPILLGYPDAAIWSLDGDAIEPIPWEAVPAVDVTRSFVTGRAYWLSRLLRPSGRDPDGDPTR
ncbi:MAG: AAA family ATPase, partial [Myxococcota bacterium]